MPITVISPVVDGELRFGRGYVAYMRTIQAPLARRRGLDLKLQGAAVPAGEIAAREPLKIEINSARLITSCPVGCGSNQYVWMSEPLFMCSVCWNAGEGYKWIAVELPADLPEAIALLGQRAESDSRNWRPGAGETIEQLRAENLSHGLVSS